MSAISAHRIRNLAFLLYSRATSTHALSRRAAIRPRDGTAIRTGHMAIKTGSAQHPSAEDPKPATPRGRRSRRRPANLAAAHLSPDAATRWIPTHIWHAKRFHTSTLWGWQIPLRRCDAGSNASLTTAGSPSPSCSVFSGG